jgi:hypothetical protein
MWVILHSEGKALGAHVSIPGPTADRCRVYFCSATLCVTILSLYRHWALPTPETRGSDLINAGKEHVTIWRLERLLSADGFSYG